MGARNRSLDRNHRPDVSALPRVPSSTWQCYCTSLGVPWPHTMGDHHKQAEANERVEPA